MDSNCSFLVIIAACLFWKILNNQKKIFKDIEKIEKELEVLKIERK